MKKFLIAFMFTLASVTAFAEASFDQIEDLIRQKNYAAAEAGLEGIIKNHPGSAKAFYAMAQAQAGLGNLDKAQKALNIATGLNPSLDFAPEGSVQKLKQAITPQSAKIEAVEESHLARNFMILLVVLVSGYAIWFGYKEVQRKAEQDAQDKAEKEAQWAKEMDEAQARHDASMAERQAKRQAEEAAEAALKAHKNYGHERFDPVNPDKLKSVKQFKDEQAAAKAAALQAAELREARARADAAEADARRARMTYSAPAPTTVVNNSGNDMLTGVLIGNMISNSGGHHHDNERVVTREVVREVPAPSRDSSWDDTPSKPSRSSSWDDDSSSKSSSSWSSSSSSSSSSWDSGSSSSDSSSSSSWD